MSSENPHEDDAQSVELPEIPQPEPKILTPEAQRALAEAEARRAAEKAAIEKAIEEGGPSGLEPTRYGDWERKGIAYDF